MTEKLLAAFKMQIASLEIIPGSGGVFEVQRDGAVIFSKKDAGRFPEWNEIQTALA